MTAIFPYRSTTIGQSSIPASELILANTIAGKALAKLWGVDFTGTTSTATNGQFVGYRSLADGQYEPIYYLATPSRIKRGSRVIAATLRVKISGSTFPSSTVPGGSVRVQVWAIRRTLVPSGINLTGLTWANYTTASTWDELGIKLGIGADTDPVYIGYFTYTQDDHNSVPSPAVPREKTVNLRAEYQRLLDFGEPLQLAFVPDVATWPQPSPAGDSMITINQPAGTPTTPHSYIDFAWRQALEFYAADAAGAIDLTQMLAAESASIFQHLFLDTPPRGASSAVKKFFLRSELPSSQVGCVVHSGKSIASPIDHSQLVTGRTGRMGCVIPYDLASGQSTPTGTWEFTWTDANTWSIAFQADGTSGFVTTGITSPTGRAKASDQTIVKDGVNALFVPKDRNYFGTFVAADKLYVDTRADMSDATHPLASLDDVYLVPHVAGNRSSADTAKARSARRATTQQLLRHDTSAFSGAVDDAGATIARTGVIARVDHAGTKRIHVKVPDPSQFLAGQWGFLAKWQATDETTGAGRVERVQIRTVYALTDATWPGQLEFEQDFTNCTVDFSDADTIFTTGIWCGAEAPPAQGFLSAAASLTSTTISLDSPLTRTTGVLTILDFATATMFSSAISSVAGNNVVLSAAPTYAFPVGSEVFFADETSSNTPFYAYASPGVSATIARKQGYVAGASFAIT